MIRHSGKNCIFRWSVGAQDTTLLQDFTDQERFGEMLWLTKLSISSFQRWFPDAEFLLLYNGHNFKDFLDIFSQVSPSVGDITYIDQHNPQTNKDKFNNPYHFVPNGVWMKWVPFRYDISKTEISIDTDIFCIGEPLSWYEWLASESEIIVAPERFKTIKVNTCGDFYKHPILKNKNPINCGIVGHKAGHDFSDRFFEVTKAVEFGKTHDSLFITEQGAINVWAYSLVNEGVDLCILDFDKNTWMRDFIYFLEKGVLVETVHAVTWHKKIALALRDILERKVLDVEYDHISFLSDILSRAKRMDVFARNVLSRQIGKTQGQTEFFFAE